jgi:antitoxin (DNA-binding transcriptional repressor) of toxin-antitoxin stability system
MTSVTIDEAETQVERGEEVIITRDEKPVARLVPYVQAQARLRLDAGQGMARRELLGALARGGLKFWEGG